MTNTLMAPKRNYKLFEDIMEDLPIDDCDKENIIKEWEHPKETFIEMLPEQYKRLAQFYKLFGDRCNNKSSDLPSHNRKKLWLRRTLSYMIPRRAKKIGRIKKRISDIFGEKSATKHPSQYLTLTLLGFYDSTMSTGEKVRVETAIEKKYENKRKQSKTDSKDVKRMLVGTHEIPVNPRPDDKQPVPILSIDAETWQNASNSVKVRDLVIRVMRNECVLFEGRHPLYNYKGERILFTASYHGDFEGSQVWVTLPESRHNECSVVNQGLKFSVQWTNDCKSGWVPRPKDEGTAPLVSVKKQPVRKTKIGLSVSFAFHYRGGSLETPADTLYVCPWCGVDCIDIYPLFKHLITCHDRFSYTFNLCDSHVRVIVTINPRADTSYEGNSYKQVGIATDLVYRRTVFTEVLVCRPKRLRRKLPSRSIAEFLDQEDTPDLRIRFTGHKRLYYHARTVLPVAPSELDYDSEGERGPDWLQENIKRMIDDFTDVNEGEKELFKMWNLHIHKYGFVADGQVPLAVKMFIKEQGRNILKRRLLRNFFLHLSNLFEYRLFHAEHYLEAVHLIREIIRESHPGRNEFCKGWEESYKSWMASGGRSGPREKGSMAPAAYESKSPSYHKRNQSSTFISGDGTLKRKMMGAPRGRKGRPPNSAKVIDSADEDSDDEKLSKVRRSVSTNSTSQPPMKKSASGPTASSTSTSNGEAPDRTLRKRKLSLQDAESNGADPAAKRVRPDPNRRKSLSAEATLRRSAVP